MLVAVYAKIFCFVFSNAIIPSLELVFHGESKNIKLKAVQSKEKKLWRNLEKLKIFVLFAVPIVIRAFFHEKMN